MWAWLPIFTEAHPWKVRISICTLECQPIINRTPAELDPPWELWHWPGNEGSCLDPSAPWGTRQRGFGISYRAPGILEWNLFMTRSLPHAPGRYGVEDGWEIHPPSPRPLRGASWDTCLVRTGAPGLWGWVYTACPPAQPPRDLGNCCNWETKPRPIMQLDFFFSLGDIFFFLVFIYLIWAGS